MERGARRRRLRTFSPTGRSTRASARWPATRAARATAGSWARRRRPDGADPAWVQGHDGGNALSFDGSSYVTVPDTGVLEPQHIARRRMGPASRVARALALRAVQGLGGLRPQRLRPLHGLQRRHGLLRLQRVAVHDLAGGLPPRSCGTGRGITSSAPTTASACGCGSTAARWATGTPASMPIAYTNGSKGDLHRHLPRDVQPGLPGRDRRRRRVGRRPGRGDDRPGDRTGARHADADRDRRCRRRRRPPRHRCDHQDRCARAARG